MNSQRQFRKGPILRVLLFSLLTCLGPGRSFAQQTSPGDALSSLLAEGMGAVLRVNTWPCVYTGGFAQQRTLPGNTVTIQSTGQFLFDCQHGLLWETVKPVASTRVYGQQGEHFAVNRSGRAKLLSGRTQARIANLLLALMGGNATSLEKDFTHTVQSGEGHAIVLLPRHSTLAQHLRQIELTHLADGIDITISASSGATTDIRLFQLSTQTLPAVTVCAQQSLQAAITCPLLFDPARGQD